MSSEMDQAVHPARVEALARKVDVLREEFETEIDRLTEENAELKKRLHTVDKKLAAIGADGLQPNSPDKRALVVRKWLYEQANLSPKDRAMMDKDVARGVLPGTSREQRYEAMRRAAGGDELARSGSSGLSPVQGIEFQKFDDPDRLSRVTIDLEAVTQKIGRQILTTEDGQEGV